MSDGICTATITLLPSGGNVGTEFRCSRPLGSAGFAHWRHCARVQTVEGIEAELWWEDR